MVDIHNYQKRAEQAYARFEKSNLPKKTKTQIKGFYRHCLAQGIGYGKVTRYIECLVILKKMIKKTPAIRKLNEAP